MNKKIAIIGGGNLGTAIAEGLIQSGFVQPKHIPDRLIMLSAIILLRSTTQ